MERRMEDIKFGTEQKPRLPAEAIDILYKTREDWLDFNLSDINIEEVRPIINWLYSLQKLENPEIKVANIDELSNLTTQLNQQLNQNATLHNSTLVPFIFAWKSLHKKVNMQSKMYSDITNQLQFYITTRMEQIVNGITTVISMDELGRRRWLGQNIYLDALSNYLVRKRSRLALYDFFIRAGIIEEERISKFIKLERNGVFAGIFGKKEVILFRKPKIITNSEGQLSSLTEPAITTLNNNYHFIDNVYFNDKRIWEEISTKTISPMDLIRLQNSEWKSIGIKLIGYEKLLKSMSSAVKVLDEYNTENFRAEPIKYQLLEINLDDDRFLTNVDGKPITDKERESMRTFFVTGRTTPEVITKARFIQVEDHSVHKQTILRVPPNIDNCLDAVAWTFSMDAKTYKPKEER